jgi:hypothetical protein
MAEPVPMDEEMQDVGAYGSLGGMPKSSDGWASVPGSGRGLNLTGALLPSASPLSLQLVRCLLAVQLLRRRPADAARPPPALAACSRRR